MVKKNNFLHFKDKCLRINLNEKEKIFFNKYTPKYYSISFVLLSQQKINKI